MTTTVCTHPTVYGPGPREGVCTKCKVLAEKPIWRIEVERLILEGKKIAAIKVYREVHPCNETGAFVGLKMAKNAVDAIEQELDWVPPVIAPRLVKAVELTPVQHQARVAHREKLRSEFAASVPTMVDTLIAGARVYDLDGIELILTRVRQWQEGTAVPVWEQEQTIGDNTAP